MPRSEALQVFLTHPDSRTHTFLVRASPPRLPPKNRLNVLIETHGAVPYRAPTTHCCSQLPSAHSSVPRMLNMGSGNPTSPWIEFRRSVDLDGKTSDTYFHKTLTIFSSSLHCKCRQGPTVALAAPMILSPVEIRFCHPIGRLSHLSQNTVHAHHYFKLT